MFVSDQFEGLAKNDFKKDSVLVEQFAWNELVAKSELPDKPSIQKEYTVDVTKYLGKPMTLAIHYQAIDDTKNSMPRYNFSEMYIENVRKDGIVSKFMPSQYGFTAVNMMCNHNLKPGWHEDQPRVWHNDQQHSRHLELGKCTERWLLHRRWWQEYRQQERLARF